MTFDGFDDRRDMEADRRARARPPCPLCGGPGELVVSEHGGDEYWCDSCGEYWTEERDGGDFDFGGGL